MTNKQLQILGAQVDMMRALLWHRQQYNEAVPFSAIGEYKTELYRGSLKKLLSAGLVKRAMIKNFCGRGTRPGYEITEEGVKWYEVNKELYAKLIKNPTHK